MANINKYIKKEMLNMSTSLAVKSGKTGIRTLGTVARSPHFECGPIDHSGIFPSAKLVQAERKCKSQREKV